MAWIVARNLYRYNLTSVQNSAKMRGYRLTLDPWRTLSIPSPERAR